ncbi:hypothetical protein L873DRAFT_1021439 [Choiromyces venosus 120613-1]|uniref:Uncharacterized protein n=1 Tax=Choiromyces venosus 120613-1 TaxID=1336337 RepID=A0A3N4JMZ6_9PEZI|nr:hypothetical protein L873DRAFT_1021439 [Choiromyces venosus 120613-1]
MFLKHSLFINMDEFFTMELNSEESQDLWGLNLPFDPLRNAFQPTQSGLQVQHPEPIQKPPTKTSAKSSTLGSWRYDFAIFINKQHEASDFGYLSKSPSFPSFERLQDKLLDDTVRILPAVRSIKTYHYLGLSATIVAMTPKELIGPTDLDEGSWSKIEHEICRLVDQKLKRNLTLSLRVDYVLISVEGGGSHDHLSSSRFTTVYKGNKKLSATQEQLNRALSILITLKARIMSEIQALHRCTGSCPVGREGEVFFATQHSTQHVHLPYSSR